MPSGGVAISILHYRLSPIRIGTPPAPQEVSLAGCHAPIKASSRASLAPSWLQTHSRFCVTCASFSYIDLRDTSACDICLHPHNQNILNLSLDHSPSCSHLDGIQLPRTVTCPLSTTALCCRSDNGSSPQILSLDFDNNERLHFCKNIFKTY
jgi:hypothetical protein